MEIMFLFFVGFMSVYVSYSVVEVLLKYFIVQAYVSLLLLGFMSLYLFNEMLSFGLTGSIFLFIKLGLFPFHFWMISILGKIDWLGVFVMLTFMKFVPILLLHYIMHVLSFIDLLVFSSVAGGVLGLNNTSIQKLMGYSSLSHLCWLLLSLFFSIKLFLIYFLSYFLVMFILSLILSLVDVFYINQFKLMLNGLGSKCFLLFLILSMGGFPPFMGFVAKWVVVDLMFWLNCKILVFTLVGFSLFSVVYYLQFFYYLMMIGGVELKWIKLGSFYSVSHFFLFWLMISYFFIYLFL